MTDTIRHFTEAFEPEAEKALSPEHAAMVSIAISLKRIADLMAESLGPDALNEYGETPFKAIGAGIARALRR